MTERARAERLDADDPLAGFRERFVIEDHETIYLDGNSLGRLPLATRERTNALLDQWGTELVRGWDEWIELPQRVGDLIGAAVLGAKPGETLVSDSTTVNLFKLAGALLAENPGRIVGDAGDFPTNRYVLDGLVELYGRSLRLTRDGSGRRPDERRGDRARLPVARRLPHRRAARHRARRGAQPRSGDLGSESFRGRRAAEGHPLRGGGHLQVPERRARAPRLPVRARGLALGRT